MEGACLWPPMGALCRLVHQCPKVGRQLVTWQNVKRCFHPPAPGEAGRREKQLGRESRVNGGRPGAAPVGRSGDGRLVPSRSSSWPRLSPRSPLLSEDQGCARSHRWGLCGQYTLGLSPGASPHHAPPPCMGSLGRRESSLHDTSPTVQVLSRSSQDPGAPAGPSGDQAQCTGRLAPTLALPEFLLHTRNGDQHYPDPKSLQGPCGMESLNPIHRWQNQGSERESSLQQVTRCQGQGWPLSRLACQPEPLAHSPHCTPRRFQLLLGSCDIKRRLFQPRDPGSLGSLFPGRKTRCFPRGDSYRAT